MKSRLFMTLFLLLGTSLNAKAQGNNVTVPLNDTRLIFSPSWPPLQPVSTCGGIEGVGFNFSAFVTLIFTGVSASVYCIGDTEGTTAQIYLDGQSYGPLDTSASVSFEQCTPVIRSTGTLSNGQHNLTLLVNEQGTALYIHGFVYTEASSNSSSTISSSSTTSSSAISSSGSSTSKPGISQSDQIALGVGISIPLAALFVAIIGVWLQCRGK